MPWHSNEDVARHNKAAFSDPKKAAAWLDIANKSLAKYGDASAIRIANSAVKHMSDGGNAEAKEDARIESGKSRGTGLAQRGHGKGRVI